LKKQLVYSTVGLLPLLWLLCYFYFSTFQFKKGKSLQIKNYNDVFFCLALGLVSGLLIGFFTEFMTSYSYKPVQELAHACKTGPATNIIYGLALGYLSTIVPVIVLCLVCYCSHTTLGYYGVSIAALGMLSNLPICLAIDSYGPVSDNAGGIA
jgi:inorganic pyrophosphatase